VEATTRSGEDAEPERETTAIRARRFTSRRVGVMAAVIVMLSVALGVAATASEPGVSQGAQADDAKLVDGFRLRFGTGPIDESAVVNEIEPVTCESGPDYHVCIYGSVEDCDPDTDLELCESVVVVEAADYCYLYPDDPDCVSDPVAVRSRTGQRLVEATPTTPMTNNQ